MTRKRNARKTHAIRAMQTKQQEIVDKNDLWAIIMNYFDT